MAPKKKGGKGGKGNKKKEVLPAPSTLSDGPRNFYIGNWSSYGVIQEICSISEELMTKYTREDREVDPLPRTNVLILPRAVSLNVDSSSSDDDEEGEETPVFVEDPNVPSEITELLIADKMQVEGISQLTVKRSQSEKKEWVRPPKPVPEGEEPPPPAKPDPSAAGEGDAAAVDPAAAVDAEPAAPTEEELAQKAYEEKMQLAEKAYVEKLEKLASTEVAVGAGFTSRDAVLDGIIRLIGVLPQIVVKPVLPTPPVREDPNAKKKGGKKGSKNRRSSSVGGSSTDGGDGAKGKKGKKGKAKKLTPEELAEIERKMAEEDALFLKQTEEAIALAKEQEEELMTYAHPYRWSNVAISNVTFTGPVQVVRAHTKFINCRFTSPYPDRPQLMIHQYCNVECVHCTFDAPARSGLYALPASQVTVRKCLFTGIPQLELYHLEHPPADEEASAGEAKEPAMKDLEDEDDDLEPKKGGGEGSKGDSDELPRTADVVAKIEKVKSARSRAVGVFTDCSKVLIDKCRFVVLGTGVLFHGKYKVERLAKAQRTVAKTQALVMLTNCRIQHAFSTGVCVDKTADDVLIVKNVISDCEYYGLDLRQGSRDISIYHNKFLIGAAIRIREGVRPQMLHNSLNSIPINDNKRSNPCMEDRY